MLIIFIIFSIAGFVTKLNHYQNYIDTFKIGDIIYTFKHTMSKNKFDTLKQAFAKGKKIEACTIYDLPTHMIDNHTFEVSKIRY